MLVSPISSPLFSLMNFKLTFQKKKIFITGHEVEKGIHVHKEESLAKGFDILWLIFLSNHLGFLGPNPNKQKKLFTFEN